MRLSNFFTSFLNFLKFLGSIFLLRVFPIITAMIVCSTFLLPFQGKKICVDSATLRNPPLMGSIDRTIEAFNRQKMPFTLGCGIGSINVVVSRLEGDILAQTIPFGMIFSPRVDDVFSPQKDYFIPLFHIVGRSVTFNNKFIKKYKTNTTLFESTLVHELGHVLGAPHQHLYPDNIMYPYISTSITEAEFDLDTAVSQVLEMSDHVMWTSYFKSKKGLKNNLIPFN